MSMACFGCPLGRALRATCFRLHSATPLAWSLYVTALSFCNVLFMLEIESTRHVLDILSEVISSAAWHGECISCSRHS